MGKGWIKIYRKIQESLVWKKSPEYLKIWLHILLEVNHKTKITQRGSRLFNYKDMASDCGVSYHTIDNCVRWLKSTKQITKRRTTRGVVISVQNYDKYQSDYETDYETHDKQLRNAWESINKNDKNDKKLATAIEKLVLLLGDKFAYKNNKAYRVTKNGLVAINDPIAYLEKVEENSAPSKPLTLEDRGYRNAKNI